MTNLFGADTRDRTGDLILTMDALYRLSYVGLKKKSGPGRIRTYEGTRPADLQSAPVDRFGTDPFHLQFP